MAKRSRRSITPLSFIGCITPLGTLPVPTLEHHRGMVLSLTPGMIILIYETLSYVPCNMSNRVRVQRHPNGQLTITIPQALAGALRIGKGDVMEWLLEDGKLLLVRVKK